MKISFKAKTILVAAVMAVASAKGETISMEQVAELALKEVVNDVQIALTASPIPAGTPVAVLPLGGEGKLPKEASVMVKSALSAAGKSCVEGKEDEIIGEIVREITWDEYKEDILDPMTVDRFGRLQSAKYLLYGWIRRMIVEKRCALVELELHATEIATKRHIWGEVFARRLYVPTDDPNGRIDLPAEVRETMRGKFRDALAASLKRSAKLAAVKKVVCLPVVADIDEYAGGLVRDVLSSSAVFAPVDLDLATRAEARFALRENPGKGDAILYGVLRDATATFKSRNADQKQTYLGQMEIQLWIENGATHEILWSDTLAASEEFVRGPRGWWDVLCAYFPALESSPSLAVVVPLGVIIVLIALIVFFKSVTRVR